VNSRDLEGFVSDVVYMCADRRVCVSATGWLCLAPASTAEGGRLVFFHGGLTPFVVREQEGGEEGSSCGMLLGPCYVHGFSQKDVRGTATVDIILR